jgi:HlyD family secretion protein
VWAAIRRYRKPALVVLGILGPILILRWTVFAPDPITVQVATVERGTVEQTVTNSRAGTVKARRRAKLSPQEGGRVVALPKREGDHVKAGDVLLQLDSSVAQARLDLARREHETAVAEQRRACLAAERAGRERDRNRRLAKQGIVSADLLDEMESAARTAAAACEAAGATVERARASIDVAERQLEFMTLRAPFDGVVADLAIEIGEWTTPSPPIVAIPTVIDIIDTTSIYVSAPMDEVDAGRLRVGLPARVAVDSHPGRRFPGRVARVGAYVLDVEEQNRTVEIEVDLDDPALASTLLPGTSADVEVIGERHDGVLRIPTGALLSGDTVLVVDDDALVERAVGVGLRNWDVTEVVSGLAEGDRVVTSLDRPEVKAGARVTIEPEKT